MSNPICHFDQPWAERNLAAKLLHYSSSVALSKEDSFVPCSLLYKKQGRGWTARTRSPTPRPELSPWLRQSPGPTLGDEICGPARFIDDPLVESPPSPIFSVRVLRLLLLRLLLFFVNLRLGQCTPPSSPPSRIARLNIKIIFIIFAFCRTK